MRIGTFCDCILSPVVLAGGIFWTKLGGDFTPANVFTALAIITIIGSTLKYLPDEYGYVQTGRACVKRFEEYLALEERKDPRQFDRVVFAADIIRCGDLAQYVEGMESAVTRSKTERISSNRVIELYKADIAAQGGSAAVLKDVSAAIERHELAMVIGPTGAGKSTFLRAILGEIELLSGSLFVEPGDIAYCDQTAWIWNATIQQNIVGNSQVDTEWYDSVLDTCLLKQDLRRLPHGDQTSAGSNGGNLSGGQKHRVVCNVFHILIVY